jgi:SAM-dependent methyltransferase
MLTVEFERLELGPGSRVLDLGCGDGRHLRPTRFLPGVAAVALDIGESEVAATARALRSIDEGDPLTGSAVEGAGPWLALRGDGYHLPFRDESFDCVIASEILEHLHDDDRSLGEIRRVLKPGGLLAVTVPRWFPERVCWALSAKYYNTPGGHVRIYRRRELKRKLSAHGYELLEEHYAHALHSPYWWLVCLLGDKEERAVVDWYHRFLLWHMFSGQRVTYRIEQALDPLIGKSFVLYGRKNGDRLPVTGDRIPFTDRGSLVTDYRSPTKDYGPPVTGNRSPFTRKPAPCSRPFSTTAKPRRRSTGSPTTSVSTERFRGFPVTSSTRGITSSARWRSPSAAASTPPSRRFAT